MFTIVDSIEIHYNKQKADTPYRGFSREKVLRRD